MEKLMGNHAQWVQRAWQGKNAQFIKFPANFNNFLIFPPQLCKGRYFIINDLKTTFCCTGERDEAMAAARSFDGFNIDEFVED